MVTLSDLEREKENILSKIAAAAVVGSSDVVLAECVKLKEIEKLIEEEKRIVSKFNRIKDATASPPDSGGKKKYISKPLPKPPGKTSATQIATSIRHAFLNKLEGEGIRLRPIEGRTLYRTSSGKKVGIAVATERLPDRWFLGLNAGTFDHAVLLCDRNGETEEILLPENFFKEYGHSLSQSGGQFKFNVVRKGGAMYVQVPFTGDVSVSNFPQSYNLLR